MTRLAQVKQERDAAKADAWTQHMCLMLALTTTPQHTERVDIPGDQYRYVIDAYGLDRCTGGYVVVRGIYPGQQDTIRAYLFDQWKAEQQPNLVQFRVAAERIDAARTRILDAA